jgi:hypothetical protein
MHLPNLFFRGASKRTFLWLNSSEVIARLAAGVNVCSQQPEPTRSVDAGLKGKTFALTGTQRDPPCHNQPLRSSQGVNKRGTDTPPVRGERAPLPQTIESRHRAIAEGHMEDQTLTCTACGTQIPLTPALRAAIEQSLRREFELDFATRERHLREIFQADFERALVDATKDGARHRAQEVAMLQEQVREQSRALAEMREQELGLRKRERELDRKQQDLELEMARQLDKERRGLVEEARVRLADEHRLRDAEKERQLADMRRQIEDLKRRAEQGSQQLQGEAGEVELETVLRDACRNDDIRPVSQGLRGADLHHVVFDGRGVRAGAILWECKNTRHWSEMWIPKLKADQRARRADVAVLVSVSLPKGVRHFAYVDGVLVTDFTGVSAVAAILRAQLIALAQARNAAMHKEERLDLLHRYLTGTDFRHRVEAVVDSFVAMRQDLEQERRAAERQWARRVRQLDAVTLNVSGMYGDLQGLVPALPSIGLLEMPPCDDEEVRTA